MLELRPSLTYRPTPALSVNGGLNITRNTDDAQWIEEVEDAAGTHYAFGRLDQTTFGLTTRVNYTLTRRPLDSAGTPNPSCRLATIRTSRSW